jgi:hypothetical protein
MSRPVGEGIAWVEKALPEIGASKNTAVRSATSGIVMNNIVS